MDETTAAQITAHERAGRKICSPESPMPKGDPGRWAHINAREIGTRFNGDVAIYECKDCGETWEAELPQ